MKLVSKTERNTNIKTKRRLPINIKQSEQIRAYNFFDTHYCLNRHGWFYLILLKKETNKSAFKQFVLLIIIFGFVLNLNWEIIHLPLYKNNVYDPLHIALCALASVADTIMSALIYFSFALIYKNAFWIRNINFQHAVTLVLIGGIGAVLAEMRHVSQGDWTYATSMPIIPLVKVGLSSILQFMILPIVTYFLSISVLKKNSFK